MLILVAYDLWVLFYLLGFDLTCLCLLVLFLVLFYCFVFADLVCEFVDLRDFADLRTCCLLLLFAFAVCLLGCLLWFWILLLCWVFVCFVLTCVFVLFYCLFTCVCRFTGCCLIVVVVLLFKRVAVD